MAASLPLSDPYCVGMTTVSEDGRRARTSRGKQAAVEAIVAVLSSGVSIQSMGHVADSTGISERTLFRYFGDQNGMFAVVAESISHLTAPFLHATPPAGLIEIRVQELAKLRCAFCQKFGHMGRTVDRFVTQFETARNLRQNREALMKAQVMQWISPEFRKIDKKTFLVINEMLEFAFVDAMNNHFGNRAPKVIADNVLLILGNSKS